MQLLLMLRDARGTKHWSAVKVAKARAQMASETRLPPEMRTAVGPVRDFSIDSPAGPLRLRHYAPDTKETRPLVVFFHGGGFVVGSLDTHDEPCRMLCRSANVHVLSVDYRLAPEHPFPAAAEDALVAYRWALDNALALGASGKVAVAGDSAGGNLAAAVAIQARNAGLPRPSLQLLIYPAVDRVGHHASLNSFGGDFLLSKEDIAWSTKHYVQGMPSSHPLVSPLLLNDHRDLGPAYVVTAGFDPLRDEGEAYADALTIGGNLVKRRRFKDFIHGFINTTALSAAARSAYAEICNTAARMLDAAPAAVVESAAASITVLDTPGVAQPDASHESEDFHSPRTITAILPKSAGSDVGAAESPHMEQSTVEPATVEPATVEPATVEPATAPQRAPVSSVTASTTREPVAAEAPEAAPKSAPGPQAPSTKGKKAKGAHSSTRSRKKRAKAG
jgi:acetyl esterase